MQIEWVFRWRKFLILTDDFLADAHYKHIQIFSGTHSRRHWRWRSGNIYSHLQCVQTAYLGFPAVSYQLLDSRLDGFSTFISGFVYSVNSYSLRGACAACALSRQYPQALLQLYNCFRCRHFGTYALRAFFYHQLSSPLLGLRVWVISLPVQYTRTRWNQMNRTIRFGVLPKVRPMANNRRVNFIPTSMRVSIHFNNYTPRNYNVDRCVCVFADPFMCGMAPLAAYCFYFRKIHHTIIK